ncbi:DUF4912 domain-containing protein [Limnoglobus roseus]|uniref:DUF4912 domain-containing protein n=1 Tax=Limnoglobus roseus TaxID=2598579 RepID=A0A5C1AJH0_9BACT|nr:DUF4912 domain-containing protein [Limnoglobus roseus]QEL17048.1 hypothetical protein PX52LOC_04024 [Limnoglobus roseus]
MKAIPAPSAAKTTKKPKPPAGRSTKPSRLTAAKPKIAANPVKAGPARIATPGKKSPKPIAKAPVPAATAKKAAPSAAPKLVKPVAEKAALNGNHKATKSAEKSSHTRPVPPPLKVIETTIPPDKDLSLKSKNPAKDRIFLMVPDPHWLHAHWELTLQSVQRAEASLGQDWHGAKPIIRLFDVTSQDTTSTSEAAVRDIVIHGGCSHWYIDVPQPPRTYRADIGYLSRRGDFKVLARSNVVTPPKAGASEVLDENWTADVDEMTAERLLAMSTGFETTEGPSQLRELFDDQLKRGKDGVFGTGAVLPEKLKKFDFTIDAELIVTGRTDASAHVTLQNEPVKLRPDGSFMMRYALTDGRQILPAVAESADGMEERTIVLAIERNTKHLDPTTHDMYGES